MRSRVEGPLVAIELEHPLAVPADPEIPLRIGDNLRVEFSADRNLRVGGVVCSPCRAIISQDPQRLGINYIGDPGISRNPDDVVRRGMDARILASTSDCSEHGICQTCGRIGIFDNGPVGSCMSEDLRSEHCPDGSGAVDRDTSRSYPKLPALRPQVLPPVFSIEAAKRIASGQPSDAMLFIKSKHRWTVGNIVSRADFIG